MQIKAEDEELERLFSHKLQHMVCSNMSELEPREKYRKLVLPKEIQESVNRIISCYIRGEDTIPSITGQVYAMGKAIEKNMGIDPKEETYKQKITKREQKRKKVKG